MLAKCFSIIRNYVLSVSSQRKYNLYYQNTLLDVFRMNFCNIIGRNPSMVIPLLANQDLTPMLFRALFPGGLAVFAEQLIDTCKEGRREKAPISYQDATYSE